MGKWHNLRMDFLSEIKDIIDGIFEGMKLKDFDRLHIPKVRIVFQYSPYTLCSIAYKIANNKALWEMLPDTLSVKVVHHTAVNGVFHSWEKNTIMKKRTVQKRLKKILNDCL